MKKTDTPEEKSFLTTLSHIDRRIMFYIMLILMAIPYAVPFSLPMPITQYTTDFYNVVEGFNKDDVVLVSMDCGLGSMGSLGGGWMALPKHLSRHNVKIVAVAAADQGPIVFETYLQPILEEAGYEYGVDFVNLGYAAGQEIMIARIGENIKTVFTNDYYGTQIDALPLMKDISGAKDFTAAFTYDTGSTAAFYSRQWTAKYNIQVLGIETAGNFRFMMPLLEAGSLRALLNGAIGIAEYEVLINAPGYANMSINALSFGHLIIITFIIIGNIVFFIQRSKGEK